MRKPICMAIQELEKKKAAEDADWADKSGRTEEHNKMPNSGKGCRGIMEFRPLGLCCVKEVARNSFTAGGVQKW